ncbi:MOSC domain-containing protein [Fretibacter rubidus]|uniref:MOSC domain-containing protein n=1 Tax=Fretibacter rubidus TaxID=570162 RepID=UPI00352AA823
MTDNVIFEGVVEAVSRKATHKFSKDIVPVITLVAGLGVSGDAHFGKTVQHRYDKKKDPTRPNLRQVHLMHAELFDDVAKVGFTVGPGDMGENIATRGLNLLGLPVGTRLHLGDDAVVELTGLRDPCKLLNALGAGFKDVMKEVLPDGTVRRKSGVMSVVITGGEVKAGDTVRAVLPGGAFVGLPVL